MVVGTIEIYLLCLLFFFRKDCVDYFILKKHQREKQEEQLC